LERSCAFFIFYGYRDDDDEKAHREEQGRLLYVAVTRAEEKLILSWPQRASVRDAARTGISFSPGDIRRIGGVATVPLSKSSLLNVPVGKSESGVAWLSRTKPQE